jgi:hypothetical protein
MATTTTNYGFDIPQSTDLVKDGATAIATLGQDIDTAMNTALGTKKAGMVLLNTTSFSGVASQDLPAATFSSTYENYKIIYKGTAGSGDLGMRLGTGGSFNSTGGNYRWNLQYATYLAGTISQGNSGASSSTFIIGNAGFNTSIDLYSPFAVRNTAITWVHSRDDYGYMNGGGAMTVTTSYDQARFFPVSGGNISGTIQVFGYNQ